MRVTEWFEEGECRMPARLKRVSSAGDIAACVRGDLAYSRVSDALVDPVSAAEEEAWDDLYGWYGRQQTLIRKWEESAVWTVMEDASGLAEADVGDLDALTRDCLAGEGAFTQRGLGVVEECEGLAHGVFVDRLVDIVEAGEARITVEAGERWAALDARYDRLSDEFISSVSRRAASKLLARSVGRESGLIFEE